MSKKRIGIRIFSEGVELNLTPEEKTNSEKDMWNQYTKCPFCKKEMRIIKWIEELSMIKF